MSQIVLDFDSKVFLILTMTLVGNLTFTVFKPQTSGLPLTIPLSHCLLYLEPCWLYLHSVTEGGVHL